MNAEQKKPEKEARQAEKYPERARYTILSPLPFSADSNEFGRGVYDTVLQLE
jgi:hypothetical protein